MICCAAVKLHQLGHEEINHLSCWTDTNLCSCACFLYLSRLQGGSWCCFRQQPKLLSLTTQLQWSRPFNLSCGFPQHSTVDTTHPKSRQFLTEGRFSCRISTCSSHGINFHTQICFAAVSGSTLFLPCSILSLESGLWLQGRARYNHTCCCMTLNMGHGILVSTHLLQSFPKWEKRKVQGWRTRPSEVQKFKTKHVY